MKVTRKVLDQEARQGKTARQIAIHDCSEDLAMEFNAAREHDRRLLQVCREFELSVGDRNAIWASHQAEPGQAADFADLYNLLARRPDRPVKFAWD